MTRRLNSTTGSVLALIAVVVLWIISVRRLQVSAIGLYGLLSAMPVTMYIGLALLTVSMVLAIHRGERQSVLIVHLILFVLMVHATPALVYGTLRYAWAWKHLGLIDYLARRHVVDPSGGGDQPVYQNWPGYFTATTTWLVGSGLKSWAGVAQWAPPAFELLFSFAVLALLRTVETDRRVIWLGVWFFAIGNWVGQDYFAPQASAYFLYLAILVIVMRWLARRPPMPSRLKRFARAGVPVPAPESETPHELVRAAVIMVLLFVVAIATSHPLTPLVLLVALTLLALTRVLRVRTLPLMAAVPCVLWLFTGARAYTVKQGTTLLKQFGKVDNNFTATLHKSARSAAAQHIVSRLGRAEVASLILLAVIGMLRRVRHGHWDLAVIALTIAPLSILVGASYGGEAVFRVYLFALPFLGYFAASTFYPDRTSTSASSAFFAIVASGVILSTFLFAYYGKEQWTYFTRGEVRAAELVFDHAQPNSLLVSGTQDYPTHFENYTDFAYVDIASEPKQSYDKVLRDPAGVLFTWLSDTRYAHAYLIITRSQKAEASALGELPPGALARIENLLLASAKFQVLYHDADATVFTVPRAPGTQTP